MIFRYEKDRMWKDASRFYKEALEIEPEQEAARERIHQIRILLSQQVCLFILITQTYYTLFSTLLKKT